MRESDEIRILLKDPHEFGEIDGAWGAGVAQLADDLGHDPSIRPLILTEPRLAPGIASASPDLPVFVSPASETCDRIARIAPSSAAYLDLLFLRGRIADRTRVRRIRSYGLRSAILGCVLARELKVTHTAVIADPFDEPLDDPRGWRRRAWIRFLEEKVAACADAIEAPDEESAERLREIVLPVRGARIQAIRLTDRISGAASCAATGTVRIAVEASTRSSSANRVVLRAMRGLASRGHLWIHWLAPRFGAQSMRARQDIRRWGLAGRLCWEDEPWFRPPHLRDERWSLLIRTDPRPGARPLHVRVRSRGTKLIVPAAGRARGTNGDLSIDWTPSSLARVLERLACKEERR